MACTTIPRYICGASRNILESAFSSLGIPLVVGAGAHWYQSKQQLFERAVSSDVELLIAVDADTLPTAKMIQGLIATFESRPDIDCLTALQSKRHTEEPLCTISEGKQVEIDGNPFQVATAHFGLAIFRCEDLKKVEKPWFHGQPDSKGGWDRNDPQMMDPDIWFWNQWQKAGKSVWVDPKTRIGHIEETVSYFDDRMNVHRCSVVQWRERFLGGQIDGVR